MLALDESSSRQPPIAAQRASPSRANLASSSALLGAIFEQDPALTKGLLRMANFVLLPPWRHVPAWRITEAIQRVGVRGVEVVVISNMVEGLMCRPGSAYSALLGQVVVPSDPDGAGGPGSWRRPSTVGNEEAFTWGCSTTSASSS